jgi:hypothetical protein
VSPKCAFFGNSGLTIKMVRLFWMTYRSEARLCEWVEVKIDGMKRFEDGEVEVDAHWEILRFGCRKT